MCTSINPNMKERLPAVCLSRSTCNSQNRCEVLLALRKHVSRDLVTWGLLNIQIPAS